MSSPTPSGDARRYGSRFVAEGGISGEKQIIEVKEDINQATLATLSRVEGVGIKRAQEIIEYRDACHGFRRMEELSLIKGK